MFTLAQAIAHVLGGGVAERGGRTLQRLTPSDAARVKQPYVITKNDEGRTIVFWPTDEEWNATDWKDPHYVAPTVTVIMTEAEHADYLLWKQPPTSSDVTPADSEVV